ncbi:hypothetical protein EDB80DRAFT_162000 [Ilyonectria destructans]|nr:hypothetical protein EDB80DRAFT_162000 [Ilyonectria destructans]
MIMIQSAFLEFATGPLDPVLQPLVSPPDDAEIQRSCRSQRVRNVAGVRNFNPVAILALVFPGLSIIAAGLTLDTAVGWFQGRTKLGDHRRLQSRTCSVSVLSLFCLCSVSGCGSPWFGSYHGLPACPVGRAAWRARARVVLGHAAGLRHRRGGADGGRTGRTTRQTPGMLRTMPHNTTDHRQTCPLSLPPKHSCGGLAPLRHSTRSADVMQELSYSVIQHLETSGASHDAKRLMPAIVTIASGRTHRTNTLPYRTQQEVTKLEGCKR